MWKCARAVCAAPPSSSSIS